MTELLPLHNQVVAISGRMVSLSHADAADLISALGGRFTRTVTSGTTMLIVGEDGLPVLGDGTPEAKLRRANELIDAGASLEILTESDFLAQVNHDDGEDSVRRQYTLPELTQIVGVKANVIRGWIRYGLLVPASTNGSLQLFDFGQVSRLRTLNELANNGLSPGRIREGIKQLGQWLNDESPLQLLTAIESHRHRLVVRLKDGRLTEPRGQLLFDFDDSDVGDINFLGLPTTPLLERALDYEEDGELELAAAVYAEVLERGDDEPETRFNFANVVYQLGRIDEAIDLFEQALDRDSEYVEAWNNLGSAYLDLDRTEDAISAFRRAIHVRPTYADAHFNLATTLDESGRTDESRSHWVAFLNLSDNARKSTRVRTRRMTARHHIEEDDDEAPQILRFDAR